MYQHGKRSRRQKNPRVYLQAAALLGVSLIGVAWILHRDLNIDSQEKTAVPIITEVLGAEEDTITINEPLFTLALPADWKQTNRVQNHVSNFYEWHSTKRGGDDRLLRLHIDTMPPSYKIVRMQPLYVNGRGFRLGNLSDNCMNFAKDAGTRQRAQGNAPVEAKWENVTFMCDPINANQTVGTGMFESGIAATLVGSDGRPHSFFFYWEDHNIRPDDKIFQNILKSFQIR